VRKAGFCIARAKARARGQQLCLLPAAFKVFAEADVFGLTREAVAVDLDVLEDALDIEIGRASCRERVSSQV
jgi:hypothetical protein